MKYFKTKEEAIEWKRNNRPHHKVSSILKCVNNDKPFVVSEKELVNKK